MRILVTAALIVSGLAAVCVPGHGLALDAPPLRVMEVLDPAHFFRAAPAWKVAQCGDGGTATIQGQEVVLPSPPGIEVDVVGHAGLDRVTLRRDGVLVVECVFQLRHPFDQDGWGEPFNTMKRVGQNELLKNIIIHGAARDSEDGADITENLPIIDLVQNTADSFILAARATTGDDPDEADGTDAIFEGSILLGKAAIPFSAIGHDNALGLDSGGIFLDWLNCLLDGNRDGTGDGRW